MLAERGVALEVMRALAGHVDVRTTQIHVDVTDDRTVVVVRREHGLQSDVVGLEDVDRKLADGMLARCGG